MTLKKAKLDLENATIKSTVNGVVKSLTDLDTAMSTSSPFLVVSGGDGFYITASLNESLLGKVHVGDTVMASSWENGQMYEAEIVQISRFSRMTIPIITMTAPQTQTAPRTSLQRALPMRTA